MFARPVHVGEGANAYGLPLSPSDGNLLSATFSLAHSVDGGDHGNAHANRGADEHGVEREGDDSPASDSNAHALADGHVHGHCDRHGYGHGYHHPHGYDYAHGQDSFISSA